MKLIEPLNPNTLNFSSVPQPDPFVGEVEWRRRGNSFNPDPGTQFKAIEATDEGVFYIAPGGSMTPGDDGIIRICNNKMEMQSQFSVFAHIPTITDMTILDGFLYILGINYKIAKYNLDGTFAGEYFNAVNSNGSIPRSIANDGMFLIVAYDMDVGQTDIKIMNRSGGIEAPFEIEVGGGREITAMYRSPKGVYVLDNKAPRSIFEVDTTDSNPAIVETPIPNQSFRNTMTMFGGVFYTCNAVILQLNFDGTRANGTAPGIREVRSTTNLVYECNSLNQDFPETGAQKEPPTWTVYGPTNKYKAVDKLVVSQTEAYQALTMEIKPGKSFSAAVAMNIYGASSCRIVVTDPTSGDVYDNTVDLNDPDGVAFGLPTKTAMAIHDLPENYPDSVVRFYFSGDNIVKVGVLVVGPSIDFGEANFSSSIQRLDLSEYSEDKFGNINVQIRPGAKLVDYVVTSEHQNLKYIDVVLGRVAAIPCVWVGSSEIQDETLTYGYYRENNLDLTSQTACDVTISVRGLI